MISPRRGDVWRVDFGRGRGSEQAGIRHVRVEPTELNGLSETSFVKCEQILTISKSRLAGTQRLGRLTEDEVRKIEIAVKLSLQLP